MAWILAYKDSFVTATHGLFHTNKLRKPGEQRHAHSLTEPEDGEYKPIRFADKRSAILVQEALARQAGGEWRLLQPINERLWEPT